MMNQQQKPLFSAAELFAACGQTLPCAPFSVTGVETDTRTLQPGAAFLALSGERFDGHDYLQTAIEKGASMCILSNRDKLPAGGCPVPILWVPDTLQAYGNIAAAYRRTLAARVIAVTGSSGKTTVKDMIAQVLSARYRTFATAGNQNNNIGMPRTILQIPSDTEMVVLEMGMNHAGELTVLSNIAQPDLGVITNIGTAHIGNLGSQSAIFHAKLEILQGMSPESGQLILNGADAFLRKTAEIALPSSQIAYIGLQADAAFSLYAEDIVEEPFAVSFTARSADAAVSVRLPMSGLHHVLNALLAMRVGLACGVSLETSARVLADFCPTALRSDRVTIGRFTIIRDYYNANPEAMRAALTALETAAVGKRRVAVLGGMNELGAFTEDAHHALGAFCQSHTDAVYFYGPACRAFAAGYGAPCCAVDTQAALIQALLDDLSCPQGDADAETVLLIKGSRGMQMEHVFDALVAALQAADATE